MASHVVSTEAMMMSSSLTLCENLPLARLAPWRVGQNPIQFIKQILHFAPSLPFGHLVTDAKLGSSRVIATARRSWVLWALETRDVAMLHGMVMSRGV
jgi:hypothetical protein